MKIKVNLKDFISKDTLNLFDYLMMGGVLLSSLIYNIITSADGQPFDWLGFFAAITGVICNVLIAKQNILNYAFGLANVILYAIIAFVARNYGNAALNMLYYVPMQFIGFYSWYNNRSESDEKKVQSSRMTLKTLIITLLITVALTFALWLILSKMEDSSPWLDSISTILSMVAMFMMIRTYAEQWYLWIVINCIQIAMWISNAMNGFPYSGMMIIMWSFFLLNSVNGLIIWLKESKLHEGIL
jgi:nicotinamide mononucleotide transporter PnuC